MNPFPHCIVIETNINIKIFVTSSLYSDARRSDSEMVPFLWVGGECANSLRNSLLLYVHCVSKEDLPVRPIGLSCVELICR